MKTKTLIVILLFLPLTPCSFAANTDVSGALQYEIGQGWLSSYFDSSESERWFTFNEENGHSYCVEVAQGSLSPTNLPSQIDVYSDEGGNTLLTSYNRTLSANNPDGAPARICYISPESEGAATRAAKISATSVSFGSASGYLKMRIIDTTAVFPSFSASLSHAYGSTKVTMKTITNYANLFHINNEDIRYKCTPFFKFVLSNSVDINNVFPQLSVIAPKKSWMSCGSNLLNSNAIFPRNTLTSESIYNVSGIIYLAHEAPPDKVFRE